MDQTLKFYREGDFLCCYGADAVIVSRALGLTRTSIKPQHETAEHPRGTFQCGFMARHQVAYFESLKAHGWKTEIIS